MIDWIAVAFSAAWIVGFSILFAQFGIRYWEQSLENEALSTPPHSEKARNIIRVVAYLLVGAGFVGNSSTLWERLLWIAFTILVIGSMYLSLEKSQSH